LISTIPSFQLKRESSNLKAISEFQLSASLQPVEDPDAFGGE
jgi:hypothetical protein